MTVASSITRRLIVNLLLSQFIAPILAWILFVIVAVAGFTEESGVSLADYSFARIRNLVIESLTRDPDGSLRVQPVQALRDRAIQTDGLRFAVFESPGGDAIAGSSPDFSQKLGALWKLKTTSMWFSIETSPGREVRGALELRPTAYGPLYVAAAGFDFHGPDILFQMLNDITFITSFILAAGAISAATTWYGVRRGLDPLRRLTKEMGGLDLRSLGQVTTKDVPTEIRPLVDAINDALVRLDASATRMRRYTANVAHELRTPVTLLRARLQNPREPTFDSDLEQDACHLETIVEQALVATRLGESQAPIDEAIDIVDVVWHVIAARARLVIGCGKHIELEADDGRSFTRGNRRALESVIANLVDNAIRAEPQGGTIIVRVGDDASVQVVDHGDGVEAADREKIFEPFWRKSEEGVGAGLGLAIAKEVMELHGGEISVGDTPGGGATFLLSFPLLSATR